MKWFFVFLIVVLSGIALGQDRLTARDSLKDAQILHHFQYRTKIQFRIGHERTLLTSGTKIKLNTFRLGVQFKYRYKFGVIAVISKIYNTPSEILQVSYYKSALGGIGFYGEYVFVDTYRFYLGAPVSFVSARIRSKALNSNDKRISQYDILSNRFNVFSMGITGGYNVNYWFTLSAGLGYRNTFIGNDSEDNTFSTPFYSLGFKIRFGQLVETVFHHKEVTRMKQAYFRHKDTWRANTFRKRHRELYHD